MIYGQWPDNKINLALVIIFIINRDKWEVRKLVYIIWLKYVMASDNSLIIMLR